VFLAVPSCSSERHFPLNSGDSARSIVFPFPWVARCTVEFLSRIISTQEMEGTSIPIGYATTPMDGL